MEKQLQSMKLLIRYSVWIVWIVLGVSGCANYAQQITDTQPVTKTPSIEKAPEKEPPKILEKTSDAPLSLIPPKTVESVQTIVEPKVGLDKPTPIIPDRALLPIIPDKTNPQKVKTLTPSQDLWERIRRRFFLPDLKNKLVQTHEKWYSSKPDYIQRMTERSNKYLFHIVEELERRNMPAELALLPFVESAFNPQAISKAKAVGMWQFMPRTGKTFDLKQNMFRDDRQDVLASTRAALDYLEKLHNMFGDWQLALAAYNWGEGNVAKAISKNKRLKRPTNYENLRMPNETKNYLPKLQAIKNIIRDPQRYQTSIPIIGNHPYFQSIEIMRDIDVAVAAELAEISIEHFKALNPSAKRPVILTAGTPQILLPWENASIFLKNLKDFKGRLATWTVWQAPKTMTVQDAAKEVGMKEMVLRRVNDIPIGMSIQRSSSLLVTRDETDQEEVSLYLANNGRLSLTPEGFTRYHPRKSKRKIRPIRKSKSPIR